MKTTTAIAALCSMLTFGIQSVEAGCYGRGESWPNREEARSFVDHACRAEGGMFTGFFEPHQEKSMCPSSRGLGLLFTIRNDNAQQGFDLGDDDCVTRLENEIYGCENGGESEVAGWFFR